MRHVLRRIAVVGLLLGAVAGCAPQPPAKPAAPLEARPTPQAARTSIIVKIQS